MSPTQTHRTLTARARAQAGAKIVFGCTLAELYGLTGISTNPPSVITRTRRSTGVERLVGTVPR